MVSLVFQQNPCRVTVDTGYYDQISKLISKANIRSLSIHVMELKNTYIAGVGWVYLGNNQS